MKYALVGCGRIAKNHIIAALANNLQIIAVCDIDISKMQDLIKSSFVNRNIKLYTNYHEMLTMEKPDLVAIATESGLHAAIALDCIFAGVNVIIEKPIALSLDDANQVITQARKRNVKVCVNHQNRFNKSIQKVREALERGRFGKMFYGTAHIRWNRNLNYYSAASWRGTWEQDGGALMNQCIHNIDLLCWMMGGDVSEVVGMTDRLNHPYIDSEDLGIALLKFTNGTYGIIEGTTVTYLENLEETLYLFGEKGLIKVGGQSVNCIEEWKFNDMNAEDYIVKEKYQEEPPNIYGHGHIALYEDMIDAIRFDKEPYIDGVAGKKALEIVLAIYRSSLTGGVIKLPMKNCSTLEFKTMFNKFN